MSSESSPPPIEIPRCRTEISDVQLSDMFPTMKSAIVLESTMKHFSSSPKDPSSETSNQTAWEGFTGSGSSSMKLDTHPNEFPKAKSKKAKAARVPSLDIDLSTIVILRPPTAGKEKIIESCESEEKATATTISKVDTHDPRKEAKRARVRICKADVFWNGDEYKTCNICSEEHLMGSVCPYRECVPPGATVGPQYHVICRGCGRMILDWSETWVCNYCFSEQARVSQKSCIICNTFSTHNSIDCPVDKDRAARFKKLLIACRAM